MQIACTRGLTLFAAFAVLALAKPALAADVEVRADPPALVVGPGDRATVNVVLSSDVALRGAQLKIKYDPGVVQIDSIVDGPYFSAWAKKHGATAPMVFPFTPDNTTGETKVGGIAVFGGLPHVGASGSAPLITVHLTGASRADTASTTLDFGAVILADQESQKVETIQVSGATVTVGPPGTLVAPAPTPFAVSQPPPFHNPAAAASTDTSPFEAAWTWLQMRTQGVLTLGVGLLVASVVYVAIVRLSGRRSTPA